MEERLKTKAPLRRLYQRFPTWMFRYGPLAGLPIITFGMIFVD